MCKGCGASDCEVNVQDNYTETICRYCGRQELVFGNRYEEPTGISFTNACVDEYKLDVVLSQAYSTLSSYYYGAGTVILPLRNMDAA